MHILCSLFGIGSVSVSTASRKFGFGNVGKFHFRSNTTKAIIKNVYLIAVFKLISNAEYLWVRPKKIQAWILNKKTVYKL